MTGESLVIPVIAGVPKNIGAPMSTIYICICIYMQGRLELKPLSDITNVPPPTGEYSALGPSDRRSAHVPWA